MDKEHQRPIILPARGKAPVIHDRAWLAPNCTVVGEVTLGSESTVWFGAIVRGDVAAIEVGSRVNIQDGAVIHGTYGQSKTASSLIAIEFNEKMKNYGVSGFAVHPGGIITPLQRHLPKEEMVALGWMQEDGSPTELVKNFFKTTNQGSSTSLWCATNEKLNGIGGVFCEDCDIAKRKSEVEESMQRYFGVADWAIDLKEASKLWDMTEKMISNN